MADIQLLHSLFLSLDSEPRDGWFSLGGEPEVISLLIVFTVYWVIEAAELTSVQHRKLKTPRNPTGRTATQKQRGSYYLISVPTRATEVSFGNINVLKGWPYKYFRI